MKRIKQIVLTILLVSLLTGCNFINNTLQYQETTKEFIESLIKEDYNKCCDLMDIEQMTEYVTIDTIKAGLANFRRVLINDWGTELEYSSAKSTKMLSKAKTDNAPPNTTSVLVEFNNKKDIGVFQVLFDDDSQKILYIGTPGLNIPIPTTMTHFWLFGLLAICIPIFNIYVLIQIIRSNLNKKWLKCIAVIFLNISAITYSAVYGLSFNPLSFQLLLGISFDNTSYLNSYWTFGIPLGGFYWFWKLRQIKNETIEDEIQIT